MRRVPRGFRRLLNLVGRELHRDEEQLEAFVERLPEYVADRLKAEWQWQAHGGQEVPDGDWTVWMLMAGRGFGKTRAGAEWVWGKVRAPHILAGGDVRPTPGLSLPGRGEGLRIALVGATREDAVRVMVEGPSGLLRLARPDEHVRWVTTRGELSLPGGAQAFVYSAEAPEALRGPEHDFAWVDELGKWPPPPLGQLRGHGDEAWDNLMMGLRVGPHPQVVVTTTPRTTPLMKRVMGLTGVVQTRGRTADNLHLSEAFKRWVVDTYGGTRLGRQELDGELIEGVEGSLFPLEVLERARMGPLHHVHMVPLPVPGRNLSASSSASTRRRPRVGMLAGLWFAASWRVSRRALPCWPTAASPGFGRTAGLGRWLGPPKRGARTGWWRRRTRAARWSGRCCAMPTACCR